MGYFDILKLSVLFSFIRCRLCSLQISALASKLHRNCNNTLSIENKLQLPDKLTG